MSRNGDGMKRAALVLLFPLLFIVTSSVAEICCAGARSCAIARSGSTCAGVLPSELPRSADEPGFDCPEDQCCSALDECDSCPCFCHTPAVLFAASPLSLPGLMRLSIDDAPLSTPAAIIEFERPPRLS